MPVTRRPSRTIGYPQPVGTMTWIMPDEASALELFGTLENFGVPWVSMSPMPEPLWKVVASTDHIDVMTYLAATILRRRNARPKM